MNDARTYFDNKGIPLIIKEMLFQLGKEKPDNPRLFMVQVIFI